MSFWAVRWLIRPGDLLLRLITAFGLATVASIFASKLCHLIGGGYWGPGRSILLFAPFTTGYALALALRGPSRFAFAAALPSLGRKFLLWHATLIIIAALSLAEVERLTLSPLPFALLLGLSVLGLSLSVPSEARGARLKYYPLPSYLLVFILGTALTTQSIFSLVVVQPWATLAIAIAVGVGALVQTYRPGLRSQSGADESDLIQPSAIDRLIFSPFLLLARAAGYFLRRPSQGKKLATILFPFPVGFGLASFLILRHSLDSSSPQLLDQIGGFYVLLFALLIGSTGANLLSTDLLMPIPRKMRLQRAAAGYWSRWAMNLLWVILGSTGFRLAEACFQVRPTSETFLPLLRVLLIDCMLFPILLWIGLIAARRPTVRVGAFTLLTLAVILLADLQSRLELNGAYLVGCALLLALGFHGLCRRQLKHHFLRGDLVPAK